MGACVPLRKRHFERFNVLSVPELTIKMSKGSGSWLLVCLGHGGCGLFTPIQNTPKGFPEEIKFKFEWPEVLLDPIEVECRLVYFVRKRLEKKSVWYVGFEFSEASKFRLEPLITQLELLTEAGNVEKFLR